MAKRKRIVVKTTRKKKEPVEQPLDGSNFIPGRKKTGGRTKGSPNRFTTLKQAFLDAFNDPRMGSTEGLIQWIMDDPGERKKIFYSWITKMLPRSHDITGIDPVTPTDLSGLKDEEIDGALIAVTTAITRGQRRASQKGGREKSS